MVFFIDEFPAVAVGDGVLEIGPGQEVFLFYLRFEDEASELGGTECAAFLQGVDNVVEGRSGGRTASDCDGWRPFGTMQCGGWRRRTASDGDGWRPFGTVQCVKLRR